MHFTPNSRCGTMPRCISAVATSVIGSAAAIGFAGYSQAALTGSTIDVAAYYPNATTVYSDPGSRVVSPVVEYPAGSYPTYNATWQIDVTDTQLILTNATGNGFPFQSTAFNGFILKLLSGPAISTASIDPSSGFSPISVNVMNGNEIDLNYSGVTNSAGVVSSIINIQTVPEPTTMLAITTGAALLLGRQRRRTR